MKKIQFGLFAIVAAITVSCANPFTMPEDFIEGDGVRLEIKLVTPEGGQALKPAVVFVGGSGTAPFDEYVPGFTEELLEDIFLPRDIAILYYNRRGVGESTGGATWSSIELRAEDTLMAVEHLRTLPGIDPDKIGVVGHSQGGWIVQLAGSLDERVAFVVSLSGPTVSVREQDLHRVENDLRCEGCTEDEIAAGLEKLNRKHETVISIGGWFPFFGAREGKNLYLYDPNEAILGLNQPTLLAFGGLDSMVPPAPNLARLEELYADTGVPSNFTTYVAENTDHMFRMAESTCFDYYASIGNPYSQPFIEYLGSWVDSLGL